MGLGGPVPRRLLAVLAVHRGAVVSLDRLLEVLWSDSPPATATTSLRTHVSRLRRVLPAAVILETVPPGYRLVVPRTAVDADRFEDALHAAATECEPNPAHALALLEEALGMWQGDAFAEFRGEWWAHPEAERLEELRLHGRELRAEALLRSGRVEDAVSDARSLTLSHPGRERAWCLLVTALQRSGRQGDALRCATDYRKWLREELGLDPSALFVELEGDVVAGRMAQAGPSTVLVRTVATLPGPDPASVGAAVNEPGAERSPTAEPQVDRPQWATLPGPSTTFIGRAAELQRLTADVASGLAITLTGPGGVGKTRLAVETARAVAAKFPEGAVFCDLAPVGDPSAVVHAVSATLRVGTQEQMSPLDSLADALRDRRLLLVLDNCEHVIDAAAELVERLAMSCPTVVVLATSRGPLGVPGERVRTVPPLSPRLDAVKLFCDRAADADATFEPGDRDMAEITAICERLDGIPLAVELAAARVRSMTTRDIADRLNDRLRFLRAGDRHATGRHQTLQATVEWSHRLLTEQERFVFDRLSVFAGSFDFAAAGAVCETDGPGSDVEDVLGGLVDKSMVVADRSDTHTRFRLLETLRLFGEERLAGSADVQRLRDRHLLHFAEVARRASALVKGNRFEAGMAAFDAEWDNLRAAVTWAVDRGDGPAGTAVVEHTFQYALWRQRHELGHWAERVAVVDGAGPGAFGVAGKFAAFAGENERALALARAGIAQAQLDSGSGTSPGSRLCWEVTGRALWFSGQIDEGWAAFQTWAAMFDPRDDPFDAAWSLLALVGFAQRCAPQSIAGLVERARPIAAPLANPGLDTLLAWASGMVAARAGDLDDARRCWQRTVDLAMRTGDQLIEGFGRSSLLGLAVMAKSGDADHLAARAVTRQYATRTWMLLWGTLQLCGAHFVQAGELEAAGVIFGHLEAQGRHPPGWAETVEPRQRFVADHATSVHGAAWMAKGADLDRDQLVEYVLRTLAARAQLATHASRG